MREENVAASGTPPGRSVRWPLLELGPRAVLVIEWAATILSLAGALWLALRLPGMGGAFVLYLAANLCWLVFGVKKRAWGLCVTQAGFTLTSLAGIATWFG